MPRTPKTVLVLALGLALVAGLTVLFTWAMDTQSYNTWGALLVVPPLVALDVALLMVVIHHQRDRRIKELLGLGFAAKLIGIFGRYFVTYFIYGGTADAQRYNLYAAEHYFNWRRGIFVLTESDKPGTQNMELITTAIYTVIGPSALTAFFVYGSLAFWGIYFTFRAFQVALPDADHRRYAALVFLLPSLLYWPSSIGKEAWLALFVGVLALGTARYFKGQVALGIALIAIGTLGSALLRPHVTVLLMAALFVAQVVRPTAKTSTSILTKAAGAFVLGVAGWILASQSAQFLGIDDFSWQAIADSYEYRSGNTEQGGSGFTPVPLDSPLGIPAAFMTVLFRPFPWEAVNLQMVIQSLEGVFLIGLAIASWPRLRTVPGMLRRHPYLVFAVVYTAAFIIAFAGFGNFGILARQRTLMLPFFLVLLCLPKPVRKRPFVTQRELVGAQSW